MFIVFTCSAKSFCNKISCSFFPLFPFCRCFRNGLAKVLLPMFHQLLPRKLVFRVGSISLDMLVGIFVNVLFIIISYVGAHSLLNMSMEFKTHLESF